MTHVSLLNKKKDGVNRAISTWIRNNPYYLFHSLYSRHILTLPSGSAALDKAYWDWYTGFCVAASSSVVTVTTVYTPTVTPYGAVSTTYEYTSEYGYTPVSSSPATGLPVPPASPVAPYGGYSTAAWGTATSTGAAYASPSASQWAPVPATGAGAVTKPGAFFAAAMALAAFF